MYLHVAVPAAVYIFLYFCLITSYFQVGQHHLKWAKLLKVSLSWLRESFSQPPMELIPTERLSGVWLRHSVLPVQYIYAIVGHGCCLLVVQWYKEHRQLKPGVLVWFPVAADLSTFLNLHLNLSVSDVKQDILKHNYIILYCDTPKLIVIQCTVLIS